MPSTTNSIDINVESALRSGLDRPIGPSGPQLALPERYYQIIRANPEPAIKAIEAELNSDDPLRRVNALDFLVRLADNPVNRTKVLKLLKNSANDSSAMVREFARNAVRRIADVSTPP